ncbi:unnamed protein product, partial [Mesorhabditis spiculigera]
LCSFIGKTATFRFAHLAAHATDSACRFCSRVDCADGIESHLARVHSHFGDFSGGSTTFESLPEQQRYDICFSDEKYPQKRTLLSLMHNELLVTPTKADTLTPRKWKSEPEDIDATMESAYNIAKRAITPELDCFEDSDTSTGYSSRQSTSTSSTELSIHLEWPFRLKFGDGLLTCRKCDVQYPALQDLKTRHPCNRYNDGKDRRRNEVVIDERLLCPIGCGKRISTSFRRSCVEYYQIRHLVRAHHFDKRAFEKAVELSKTTTFQRDMPHLSVEKSFASYIDAKRPFACSACYVTFKYEEELRFHFRRQHTDAFYRRRVYNDSKYEGAFDFYNKQKPVPVEKAPASPTNVRDVFEWLGQGPILKQLHSPKVEYQKKLLTRGGGMLRDRTAAFDMECDPAEEVEKILPEISELEPIDVSHLPKISTGAKCPECAFVGLDGEHTRVHYAREHKQGNALTNGVPWFSICGECEKPFSDFDSLRTHVADAHAADEECYKCPTCCISFQKAGHFRTHMARYHPALDELMK